MIDRIADADSSVLRTRFVTPTGSAKQSSKHVTRETWDDISRLGMLLGKHDLNVRCTGVLVTFLCQDVLFMSVVS